MTMSKNPHDDDTYKLVLGENGELARVKVARSYYPSKITVKFGDAVLKATPEGFMDIPHPKPRNPPWREYQTAGGMELDQIGKSVNIRRNDHPLESDHEYRKRIHDEVFNEASKRVFDRVEMFVDGVRCDITRMDEQRSMRDETSINVAGVVTSERYHDQADEAQHIRLNMQHVYRKAMASAETSKLLNELMTTLAAADHTNDDGSGWSDFRGMIDDVNDEATREAEELRSWHDKLTLENESAEKLKGASTSELWLDDPPGGFNCRSTVDFVSMYQHAPRPETELDRQADYIYRNLRAKDKQQSYTQHMSYGMGPRQASMMAEMEVARDEETLRRSARAQAKRFNFGAPAGGYTNDLSPSGILKTLRGNLPVGVDTSETSVMGQMLHAMADAMYQQGEQLKEWISAAPPMGIIKLEIGGGSYADDIAAMVGKVDARIEGGAEAREALCDCGGRKARTPHSSWCTSGLGVRS